MKTRNTTDWIRRVLAQEARLPQRLELARQDILDWAKEARKYPGANYEGMALAYENAAGLLARLLDIEEEEE